MLVSGVPVKIDEHAREMSLMALSMLEKIQTVFNPFTNKPLELQVGKKIPCLLFVISKVQYKFSCDVACTKDILRQQRVTL